MFALIAYLFRQIGLEQIGLILLLLTTSSSFTVNSLSIYIKLLLFFLLYDRTLSSEYVSKTMRQNLHLISILNLLFSTLNYPILNKKRWS